MWTSVFGCIVECHTAVQVAGAWKRRHARQSRRLPDLPEQDWAVTSVSPCRHAVMAMKSSEQDWAWDVWVRLQDSWWAPSLDSDAAWRNHQLFSRRLDHGLLYTRCYQSRTPWLDRRRVIIVYRITSRPVMRTVLRYASAVYVNPLKGRGVNWLHFAIQV